MIFLSAMDDYFTKACRRGLENTTDIDYAKYINVMGNELREEISSEILAVFSPDNDNEGVFPIEHFSNTSLNQDRLRDFLYRGTPLYSFNNEWSSKEKSPPRDRNWTPDSINNIFTHKEPFICNNIAGMEDFQNTILAAWEEHLSFKVYNVMAVPMILFNGIPSGALLFVNKNGGYNEEDKRYATLRSRVFGDMFLVNSVRRSEGLISLRVAELRDPHETGNHVKRVGKISRILYKQMAQKNKTAFTYANAKSHLLEFAAFFHDVGKVDVADRILKKPDRLTEEEFSSIRMHPGMGAWIFNDVWRNNLAKMIRNIILGHHQRWDGNGYPAIPIEGEAKPRPLKEKEIPLEARIVSVADVLDALYNRRVYKDTISMEESLKIIAGEKEKHFDPEVVDALFEIVPLVQNIMNTLKCKEKTEEYQLLELLPDMLTL